MKDQINTIREALAVLEAIGENDMYAEEWQKTKQALTALTQLEAMLGEREPVGYYYPAATKEAFDDQMVAELYQSPPTGRGHIPALAKPLYAAAPVAQQYEAGDMADAQAKAFRAGVASVTQQEPVARYNWHTAKLEWLVPYKADFNMKPMYFAAPVAQQQEPVAEAESLRLAGLTLIGLAEHDQHCEVFDLDDEGKHRACTCGLDGAIATITQAGKTAAPVAQQQEPDLTSLLFAVEQAVKNGHCPWEIEVAFDEYEAARRAAPVAQPQAEPDMRKVCEALGFDPTNHHNAAKCPYCRGQQPQAEAVRWGVDWGTHGDRTCVSIIKKHADGKMEVVATEYEPERKATPQQAEAVPPGYVPVPVDALHDWKGRVNTLATLSSKSDRYPFAIKLKQDIADAAIAQQKGQP